MLGAVGIALQSPVPPPVEGGLGQIMFKDADGRLVPIAFRAVTEHWYGVWLTRPATMTGLVKSVLETVGLPTSGTHVAVKSRIGEPPMPPGVNATAIDVALAEVAEMIVGGCGTADPEVGTKLFDAVERRLVPIPFVAVTTHV